MMNTVDRVKAAKSPQHALLEIAYTLDRLMEKVDPPDDNWQWGEPLPQTVVYDEAPVEAVTTTPDGSIELRDEGAETIVTLPPVPSRVKERRRKFAEHNLNLDEALPDIDGLDAYEKGGAAWLYMYDRDLVMSYPVEIRKALVDDMLMVDAKAAAEMARDLLKDRTPGPAPSLS